MYTKPSPLENVRKPKLSIIITVSSLIGLELTMFFLLFIIYTETIGMMKGIYLSGLPIVGPICMRITPDANASHILCFLLSLFSTGTPIFIWSEIFRQNILDNPREWLAHPQNQIIASCAGLILFLAIGLEVTNIFTLIAKEATSATSIFLQDQDNGLMTYLAENKGMAIAVSVVMAVINFAIAFFTVRTIRSLKTSHEV